jgi:DeoR/GlpR family transcriptional regulator of sugar metabolism
MAMLPAERLKSILADIVSKGSGTIPELSEKYGVSDMTIRRDLKTLEEQGHILRTYGGAIYTGTSPIEPLHDTKLSLHGAEKQAIAKFAVEHFIHESDIIILEGGTTIEAMFPHVARFNTLTIMTNSLYTLRGLKGNACNHTIISSGGMLRSVSFTFVGPLAEKTFQQFNAKTVFLSATGWTPEFGFSDPGMLDTQVKKAIIEAAEKTIMLVDSSKFGVTSLTTFLGAYDADVLITDPGAPSEALRQLEMEGVQVFIADQRST